MQQHSAMPWRGHIGPTKDKQKQITNKNHKQKRHQEGTRPAKREQQNQKRDKLPPAAPSPTCSMPVESKQFGRIYARGSLTQMGSSSGNSRSIALAITAPGVFSNDDGSVWLRSVFTKYQKEDIKDKVHML